MSNHEFNAKEEIKNIIEWVKKYFVENGQNAKAVIGMSGGKDSTITAALLCKALGPEKVFGVIMPDGNTDKANTDAFVAKCVCEELGMGYREINIGNIVAEIYNAVGNNSHRDSAITTNTPARVRMSVLYAVAAYIHGRVVNTCNKSEDYVGFSTKYGDLAGDFSVLKNYPVRWILEIGDELGLHPQYVHRVPDDGMCGQTDEEKFGFTYETLDSYIIDGIVPEYSALVKITNMHEMSRHKDVINIPAPMPVCIMNEYNEHSRRAI